MQIADCPKCRNAIHDSQSESWCVACGTPFADDIATLLPVVVARRSAGALELPVARSTFMLSRGERIFRGMVGMGAVFAAVSWILMGALGAWSLVLAGTDFDDLDFMVGALFASTGIAFVLGMFYAGLLAIIARGRPFHQISIVRAAAAGLVPGAMPSAVFFALGLIQGTSVPNPLDLLTVFPPLSAAVAVVTLLIARRAKPEPVIEG